MTGRSLKDKIERLKEIEVIEKEKRKLVSEVSDIILYEFFEDMCEEFNNAGIGRFKIADVAPPACNSKGIYISITSMRYRNSGNYVPEESIGSEDVKEIENLENILKEKIIAETGEKLEVKVSVATYFFGK